MLAIRRSAATGHWLVAASCLVLLAPALHAGEARAVGVFVVNSVGDARDRGPGDGVCSTGAAIGRDPECTLRAALEEANATPGTTAIAVEFSDGLFPTSTTEAVFEPATPYPPITRPIAIRGETAKPWDPVDPFSRPWVTISGARIATLSPGLAFVAGGGSSYVGAISIAGFPGPGLFVDGADALAIQGCWIGVRGDGGVDGNGLDGIRVTSASQAVVVGGPSSLLAGSSLPASGRGNVISGNGGHGIFSEGRFVVVLGNRIGTDPTGREVDLGGGQDHANQGFGIRITGDQNDVGGEPSGIGLATAGRGNLVSGNGSGGIEVTTGLGLASRTRIAANSIGTDVSGTRALGNEGPGIAIASGTVEIGGYPTPADDPRGNVISGNLGDGVVMAFAVDSFIADNVIGLSVDGELPLGNGGAGVRLAFVSNVGVDVNVIGDNGDDGVTGTLDEGLIRANRIGLSRSGAPRGNVGDGVDVEGTSGVVGVATTFGGELSAGEGNAIAFNGGVGIRAPAGGAIGVRGNTLGSNASIGLDLGYASQGQYFAPVLLEGDWNPATGEGTVTYVTPDFGFGSPLLAVDFFLADADGEEPAIFLGTDVLPGSGAPSRTFAFMPPPSVDVQSGALVVAMASAAVPGTTVEPFASTEVSNAVPLPEPGSMAGMLACATWLVMLERGRPCRQMRPSLKTPGSCPSAS